MIKKNIKVNFVTCPPVDLKMLFEGRTFSFSLLGYDVADFLDCKSFKVETDSVIPLQHHQGRSLNNTGEKKCGSL